MVEQSLAVLTNGETYRRILYLLLAFPLGIAYSRSSLAGWLRGWVSQSSSWASWFWCSRWKAGCCWRASSVWAGDPPAGSEGHADILACSRWWVMAAANRLPA